MSAPGITVPSPAQARPPAPAAAVTIAHKVLLGCGVAAPLLYAAMLVFVPLRWPGYSSAAQTVSELSAIGAPSRPLWMALGIAYTILVVAFGWGVWTSAGRARPLRVVGGVMIAAGLFGALWPPMHMREVLAAGGGTLTDTLHIVWTAVNGAFMLLAMGFSAAAFGRRFRVYAIASIVLLLGFGILTSIDAPRMEANLPTPLIGVWERLNIGVFLLWFVALAVMMLRKEKQGVRT